MKTFRFCGLLLMAVLMAFTLAAGGDDDDDDVPASIVGTKWYHEQIGDGEIWAYTIFCFNQGGVLDVEHLVPNDDGKWYKGLSHRYSYSVSGNQLSIVYHEGEPAEKLTWDGHNSPLQDFKRLEGEVLQLYNNARPDSEMHR